MPAASRAAVEGRVRSWLRAFWPAPVTAGWRERVRVTVGAGLGLLVTGLLSQFGGAASAWPWLIAPMGASVVLIFGAPASPLAQPWSVIGGNTVSALVGVACVRLGGSPVLMAAVAVGLAIGVMFALRCLHPPGGATALLVVLTGVGDPAFAFYPVLCNSALLVAVGIAYNHATRRAYPHHPVPVLPYARDAEAAAIDAELDAVLARHSHTLDIGRDELKALLEDTQLQSYQRKLANIRCRDIMSSQVITVRPDTLVASASELFRHHRIKSLPVVDQAGGVVGIVTPADLARGTAPAASVSQIMTRHVRVAGADRHLVELIPLFGGSGHHHIPIVDDGGRLVGIITQSDVVAALCRPTASPAG
jgi:CBS domain-containing membrane protein